MAPCTTARRPTRPAKARRWCGSAYRQPMHIDEIRITALDVGWEPLASSSVAVDLAWSPATGNRVPAAWAGRLSNEQQEAVRQQIEQRDSSGGALLFFLLVGGVLGYFVLQPLTVLWLDGRWRLAAAAPLIATVPLMLHAAYAFAAGANLWPLLLIFCLPVATLYLLGWRACTRSPWSARLPDLVAVGDDARVAHHVDQDRALHEILVLLVLEEQQRVVLEGGNVARHLPSLAEQLFDRGGRLLGRPRARRRPDARASSERRRVARMRHTPSGVPADASVARALHQREAEQIEPVHSPRRLC